MSPSNPFEMFNKADPRKWLQENRRRVCDGLSNVSLFWVAMLTIQRMCGVINLHAGLPAPVTIVSGAAIITTSHVLSSTYGRQLSDIVLGEGKDHHRSVISRQELLRGGVLALSCYSILERNCLRSTLPSSIISRGAYSRTVGRVPSTSASATTAQRTAIQRLGRRFGCHHCGRRTSIFNGQEGFIADHIPPTRFVNKVIETWYGKFYRKLIPVSQNLYPQCRRCFSLQGSFVKTGAHMMIFHDSLRLVHLSPVLVGFLLLNDDVRDFLDTSIVLPIDKFIRCVEDSI